MDQSYKSLFFKEVPDEDDGVIPLQAYIARRAAGHMQKGRPGAALGDARSCALRQAMAAASRKPSTTRLRNDAASPVSGAIQVLPVNQGGLRLPLVQRMPTLLPLAKSTLVNHG